MMTQEEYINEIEKCRNKDCTSAVRISYIKSLEAQNKSLTDMVQLQSEKISSLENRVAYFEDDGSWNELVFKCKLAENKVAELEAPKSCEGCMLIYSRTCIYCSRMVSLTDYYEPKDN